MAMTGDASKAGEGVDRAAIAQRERAFQSARLRRRDMGDAIELGSQQLAQAGVGQPRLRGHPASPQHAQRARPPLGVAQQLRLADPRLANEGEHHAAPRAGARERPLDRTPLAVPPKQHGSED